MLKLANSGGAGSTQAWAQQMLEPGIACILDCETTDLDGAIIELAIIDAATGNTLFDSLIDPGGIAIAPRGCPGPRHRSQRSPRRTDVAGNFPRNRRDNSVSHHTRVQRTLRPRPYHR